MSTAAHSEEESEEPQSVDKESIKHLLTRDAPYPKLIMHRMEAPKVHFTTIQKEENIEEFWHGKNQRLKRKIARNDFSEFNLREAIMKRLISKKYWTPTPIQSKAIPLILEGRHCIIQSQTGTGKTL